MTLREFTDVFAALAVQLRWTDADELTIRVYYEPLKDLAIEFVAAAARDFAQGRCEFHPKTSEWRQAAIKVEQDRTAQLRERLRKRPEPLCGACGDTTWMFDPAVNGVRKCGCVVLRRLEVLGRRPLPALREGAPPPGGGDAGRLCRPISLI